MSGPGDTGSGTTEDNQTIDLSENMAACARVPQHTDRMSIDDHGDLWLYVGTAKCIEPTEPDHRHQSMTASRVCSKSLSRACPVLSKLLNGGFTESRRPDPSSGEEWAVKLPDDDPKPMEVLLNIAHCRFDLVSEIRAHDTSTIGDLYDIAVVTDKYDCTALIRPWAQKWSLFNNMVGEQITSDLYRLAWISWELGDIGLFKRVFNAMVCRIPPATAEEASDTQWPSDVLEPPGLQGMLA